jgi:hypothetical protein
MVMDDVDGGEGGVKNYDRPVFLPSTLDSYDGNYLKSPGRPGIPAFVPSWSQTDEKRFLDGLLKDLNENLLAGLDPNPNLSRSKVKPAMYPAVRSGVIEKIVFVGGSNAKKLSQAAALLGIDAYMIAKGGWKLNRENVDKLIPDLHELLSGLPPGTPIVLFCLDNTSFLAATEEGGMVPISKYVTDDSGYHVNGALVVAPERAIQNSVEQLKRIVAEFGDFDLFIVSPLTRYVAKPCCIDTSHVTNFGEPGFLQNILSDLTKLKFQLKKKLQPATVLDGIELVCGTGCSKDKIEQTLTAGWALDPVHPSSHVYAKMALNLIEAVAAPKPNSDSKKRKRSEDSGSGSGSSSQYGSGSRQPRPVRTNESPRSHTMGSGFAALNAGSSYGPGSGYGPGYGSTYTGNRFQNQSYFPMRPRGSAVSVSSRGTMGSFSSSADRGGNNGGYRGGGGSGYGGRGPLRGRPWPRW